MRYRTLTSLVVCLVSAAIVGCATSTGQASLECGLGGAGLGYLACKLAGGSDSQCLAVAAGTGGAGAIGCAAYAKHLDNRRKQLAGKENNLDAQIQYVQGLNSDTQQLNAELTKRVSSTTQDTDRLVAQIRQQQITSQQLANERRRREQLVKAAQTEVDQGAEALQTAKRLQAQRSNDSPALDAAIAQQEKLLAQAQQRVDQLSAQRARV
jgi:hypothetical protein